MRIWSLTTCQPFNYSIKFKISTAELATCFLLFSSNRVKRLVYIISCDKQFKKLQCHSICLLVCLLGDQSKGKMSQEVEKVHNFFDRPPSLRMIWTLLNLGKIGNWEKFELWDPPWKIKHKLKTIKSITLKLTCFLFNRGIYSLHLNLGKTWKFGLPPLLSKSLHFKFWTFWFCSLIPPPLLDFFHFLGHFYFDWSPLLACPLIFLPVTFASLNLSGGVVMVWLWCGCDVVRQYV